MTRGNQRELAREKAEKKTDKKKKKGDGELTLAQKRQRDAEAIQAKQKSISSK